MWDWITDAFTITFGEALLENLYLIIVIYIISLGYLNYSINRDLDKILGSENANENEDEEQSKWESRGSLHVTVSFVFITGSLVLMMIIFSSVAALAGYTPS